MCYFLLWYTYNNSSYMWNNIHRRHIICTFNLKRKSNDLYLCMKICNIKIGVFFILNKTTSKFFFLNIKCTCCILFCVIFKSTFSTYLLYIYTEIIRYYMLIIVVYPFHSFFICYYFFFLNFWFTIWITE